VIVVGAARVGIVFYFRSAGCFGDFELLMYSITPSKEPVIALPFITALLACLLRYRELDSDLACITARRSLFVFFCVG